MVVSLADPVNALLKAFSTTTTSAIPNYLIISIKLSLSLFQLDICTNYTFVLFIKLTLTFNEPSGLIVCRISSEQSQEIDLLRGPC